MKQLYLLVARCIAYPFNARFQMETTPPKPKLNEESYFKICGVLQSCVDQEKSLFQELILSGNEQKCIKSSEFCTTVEWYLNNILLRDDVKVACFRGGFSTKEIEHTFRVAIARQFRDIFNVNEIVPGERLTKRIEGDPKFQVWVSTFVKLVELGRQMTMSEKEKKKLTKQSGTADKDELYSMFQMILGISRSEHQALFRACHVRGYVCVCFSLSLSLSPSFMFKDNINKSILFCLSCIVSMTIGGTNQKTIPDGSKKYILC